MCGDVLPFASPGDNNLWNQSMNNRAKRGDEGQNRNLSLKAVLLGCTALAALAPTSLLAQQADENTTMLETITVEGRGAADDDARSIVASKTSAGGKIATDLINTPASVSVITSKEMQQRGVETVEQALQYTAGASADFYGSDDRFDYYKLRGFDAYAYRDGLAIGRPFGGIREESYAFERIEVLKGGNSTAYGVSDPGGAVNYVTKRPKSEKFGEVYATGGSFSRAETGFDFGDNITEDDTLSYRLTGKVKDAKAEYDFSRDDEKFIMGGLTWRPSDATTLTVVYDHLNRRGVPGGGGHPVGTNFDRNRFFGEPDYNYRDTDRDTVSVMFDHDFGTGLKVSSNARYSNTKSDFGYAYIARTPTNGSTIAGRDYFGNDSSGEHFVIDSRAQYDASFGNVDSSTLVGVLYSSQDSSTDSFYGAAPSINWVNPVYTGRPNSVPLYASSRQEQFTKALYAQQDFTFSDRLIATIGLRNDWIDTTLRNNLTNTTTSSDISAFTTRYGLTYKISEELAAYASYSESVVPASSLTLEPEEGEQYEIGVKYQPLDFPALFSAAIYDLTKKNITRTNPTTLRPETIGEVRVRGLDLEAKAELTNNISLTAAYSYLDAEIVRNGTAGNEGKRPSLVPEHVASLWVNYMLAGEGARGDMNFGVGGRYTGSYYFDDANTKATESAVVFDAAFSYAIQENTTFSVNVSNIFDEKHVAYGGFGADFYNPGRAISATLRRTW